MKNLLTKIKTGLHLRNQLIILFLLFSATSFSQVKDVPRKPFKVTDRIAQQQKLDHPLCFTNDNILLNITKIETLNSLKKIKSLNVIQSNEGQKLYGELAKNGLIIVELQDTIIKSENIIDILKRTHPENSISVSNILINGLQTTDEKIKFPKWDKLILDFDSKSNRYNIKDL